MLLFLSGLLSARSAGLTAEAVAVAEITATAGDVVPPARWICQLQAPAQVGSGEPVPVTLRLTLHADRPWWLLRWGTPFDPVWTSPWLRVRHGGRALPFAGATVKRADPLAADYLPIQPGQTLQATVDLRRVFSLDAPGLYQLLPQLQLHDAVPARPEPQPPSTAGLPRPRAQHQAVPLRCPALQLRIGPADGAVASPR